MMSREVEEVFLMMNKMAELLGNNCKALLSLKSLVER